MVLVPLKAAAALTLAQTSAVFFAAAVIVLFGGVALGEWRARRRR